jgi:DNA-binding transcriptional MocR family regulator
MIGLIRAELREQSAAGVARSVALLAGRGDIAAGSRLPTVREVARELGMSSSTVGEAWRTLAMQGILDTQGRRGTFLRRAGEEPVRHFRHIHEAPVSVDLSTGYPDPTLLLDLRPYLREIAEGPPFHGYPDKALSDELRQLICDRLPFTPGSVLLGTDALSTVSEVLSILIRFGERVIVGSAEFAPYLDLLERRGAEKAPVPFDDDGFELEAVRTALRGGARLILLQPRVHNPTGRLTSRERLAGIAEACREHDANILEVDHFGDLSSSPVMSAAETAPERTIHMRSYSKDLHPDLRVCSVVGPTHLLDRLYERRIGGYWVSDVNQRLIAALLASPDVPGSVRQTKAVYDARRTAFVGELRGQGLEVHSRDGFNVWVPVRNEESALVYLAARGVGAAPGAPFRASPGEPPHLRVSIAAMGEEEVGLAQTIALAGQIRRLGAFEPRR